jgi:hypothetical protein
VQCSYLGDSRRVISDTGGVVGHFVTHGPHFNYGAYIGLHLGQVDRLTFISSHRQTLFGRFIDCRIDSPTLGRRVSVTFDATPSRKLSIPMGVAHTFDNIQNVVTRNDLQLYSSSNNLWRFEDDLVSMPASIAPDEIVPIAVNSLPLPKDTAILFYRLQSQLMVGGRDRLRLSSDDIIDDTGYAAKVADFFRAASRRKAINGISLEVNSIFPVANQSWGIIASTSDCVMELFITNAALEDKPYCYHKQHDILLTFLDRRGDQIELSVIDLRLESPSRNIEVQYIVHCDERFRIRIPIGVAYKLSGEGGFCIRRESELFLVEGSARFSNLSSDTFLCDSSGSVEGVYSPTERAAVGSSIEHAEFV